MDGSRYKVRVQEADSAFPTSFVLYDPLTKLQAPNQTQDSYHTLESDILRGKNIFHLIYNSS